MDYKKAADEASEKVLSYLNADMSEWKVVKSTKNITVHSKPSGDFTGTMYRAESLVEMPHDKFFPFLYLPEYRGKWDKAVQSYKLVETIDEVIQGFETEIQWLTTTLSKWLLHGIIDTWITMTLYRTHSSKEVDTFIFHVITHSYGFGLVSPRDFVNLLHVKRYGDLITANTVSIDHPDYPPCQNYIRGSSFPSGYACSPLPENPEHTKFVAILQADLGGMLMPSVIESVIPTTIINSVTDFKAGLKSLKGALL